MYTVPDALWMNIRLSTYVQGMEVVASFPLLDTSSSTYYYRARKQVAAPAVFRSRRLQTPARVLFNPMRLGDWKAGDCIAPL